MNPLRWWRAWRYHGTHHAGPEDELWAARLISALHDEAARIEPAPGGLAAIRARLGHDTYAWGPDITQPDLGVAAQLPRPYVPPPSARCPCCGKELLPGRYGEEGPFCWTCGLSPGEDPAGCDDPEHYSSLPAVQPDLGIAAALPGPRPDLTCPVCGGEPEICADEGHDWVQCPGCGSDMRPAWEECQDCGMPLPRSLPVPVSADPPGAGRPTAAELGTAFMGGLEEHMAREAPGMWAEWYADYASLRWREFMAQWFGAR